MELQEDAYRLQQVLTDVSYTDIVTFLRTKIPNASADIRCRIALQYFFNVQNKAATTNPSYEDDLTADLLCLRHVLKTVSDEKIRCFLKVLGPIPNRKLVAAKLLMYDNNAVYRKKRLLEEQKNDGTQPSSSKLVKVADSTNSLEAVVEGKPRKPRRKANLFNHATNESANEIMQATVIPNEHNAVPVVQRTKRPATVTNGILLPNTGAQRMVPEDLLPSSSTNNNLDYDAPGPSRRRLDDAEAGPSRVYPQIIDPPQPQAEEPAEDLPDSDETVIDLSASAGSLPDAEAIVEPTVQPETVEVKPYLPVDEKLVHKLLEMFPEALPDYVRRLCGGMMWCASSFAHIVDVILNDENYPRRPPRSPSPEKEIDPEEQLSMLKAVLPDADPTYLQRKIEELGSDQNLLRNFIEDAVDNKRYPTMKDALRQQQLSAQQRQYTTEFNVERFVEIFPDPVATFEDPNRKTTILSNEDKFYVKWFVKTKFRQYYTRDLDQAVEKNASKNVLSIVTSLQSCMHKQVKDRRFYLKPESQNIPLLQELAYWEHKDEILKHFEDTKIRAIQEKEMAKDLGLFQTCVICCEDEIMPADILTCMGGCRFCRTCIKTSVEVAFGDGKMTFKCLSGSDCTEEFALQVLQNVLPPKLFSILAQKKAVAEVKAAGVEDLEMCPFCDFANIPAPEDKLFRCLNPECMKESCRLCKEPSHVPLRCEEVEKDEAVKARTYIENKMTEALLRECWKCGAKFFKEEGCNKMTCSCGAMMCYVCRKPVTDYKHFNGQGGDRYDLCALYTDNFSVNEQNVLKAAEEAKKEINPDQLINDPTADLQKHFEDKIKAARTKQLNQQYRQFMHNVNVGVHQARVRHHRHHHHGPLRHRRGAGEGYNLHINVHRVIHGAPPAPPPPPPNPAQQVVHPVPEPPILPRSPPPPPQQQQQQQQQIQIQLDRRPQLVQMFNDELDLILNDLAEFQAVEER